MTGSERIEYILKFKKVSKKEFSDKVNRNINTLSKMFQNKSDPKLSLLQDILKEFPDANARWLILEEGKPFKQKKVDSGAIKDIEFLKKEVTRLKDWMEKEKNKK